MIERWAGPDRLEPARPRRDDPRYNVAYLRLREKIAEIETIPVSDEVFAPPTRPASGPTARIR